MCCCCIRRKNSSMVQSGHRFSLPFVIRESLKIAAAISVLLVSALYISNNVGKPAPVLEMNKIVVPPGQRRTSPCPTGRMSG